MEASHPKAQEVVKHIAKLYQIETRLRDNPELDRATYRQKHAPEHLGKIKEILEKQRPRTLPQSNFGKAINYTLERWEALNLYLEHGKLEIDNNLVENAIRLTAIGKKNWLFFGSPTSSQESAILYSLIAEAKRSSEGNRAKPDSTCSKLDLNPGDYLRDLLEALPTMKRDEVAGWTPAEWNASRKVPPTPAQT